MIHIFDNYYIFEHEDLHWYQLRCKVNDKISLMEDLVVGEKGILYCNYLTMCHIAYNLSDSHKMISDCRDFEENYGTNWVVKDTKLFPGYFKEWVLSMEWIYKDIEPNFTEYWKTIIGKGSLLKTWIKPTKIDNKTKCETHQVGPTISFCKDSKFSMSFDHLPSEYLLPIIFKKII
jgi:hypothetical protein